MQLKTRDLFNQYTGGVASSNGLEFVKNEAIQYTPSRQQSLFAAMGENADFLKKINHVPVDAQVGDKIGLGISRPIAGRTNTDENERSTKYVGNLDGDSYHAMQTNFDTHLKYSLMDSWAHTGKFKELYIAQVMKQVARDVLMVGWNGESAAAETDFVANPLLQDVNIGWLEKVRQYQPARFMGYDSEGDATTDTYNLGIGGDYETLDALVFDLTNNLLDAWHQGADDLVVIVGREIWVDHGMTLLANSVMPTERNALSTWFAAQTVAGLPCVMPPFFPSRGIVVTSYENLSVYHQLNTLRRTIMDNPKRDRVEEYFSENQAYVVEDYGKFAGVRPGAILLKNNAGTWS